MRKQFGVFASLQFVIVCFIAIKRAAGIYIPLPGSIVETIDRQIIIQEKYFVNRKI